MTVMVEVTDFVVLPLVWSLERNAAQLDLDHLMDLASWSYFTSSP